MTESEAEFLITGKTHDPVILKRIAWKKIAEVVGKFVRIEGFMDGIDLGDVRTAVSMYTVDGLSQDMALWITGTFFETKVDATKIRDDSTRKQKHTQCGVSIATFEVLKQVRAQGFDIDKRTRSKYRIASTQSARQTVQFLKEKGIPLVIREADRFLIPRFVVRLHRHMNVIYEGFRIKNDGRRNMLVREKKKDGEVRVRYWADRNGTFKFFSKATV
jgi:hypothetical protein